MRTIFLVGMPSSGKSTLGRQLARTLGYRFVDLDQLIVKDQRKPVAEIFAKHGEAYFRKVEQRLLRQTLPDQSLVVATGGGTPCFFDNMLFINENGLSVFLDVAPSELARRIVEHGRDDRPLLSGVEELEKELTDRLAVRFPFYAQATLAVPGTITAHKLVGLLRPIL